MATLKTPSAPMTSECMALVEPFGLAAPVRGATATRAISTASSNQLRTMVHMDAGVAALWGAGIGGVLGAGGVLGSTWLAGRAQGRTQHQHWRRQGRREAYSTFIAAVTAHRDAADDLMALMEETHSPDDASQALERVSEKFPAVRAASSVVAVEGPADVAASARDVMESIGRATEDIDFYVTAARRFGRPGEFEAGRAQKALDELGSLLRTFTENARDALDV